MTSNAEQTLSDRLDIADLIYRYASRFDEGSVDEVLSCFTFDAYAEYNDGATVLQGAIELRQFFDLAVQRLRTHGIESPSMHVMNNVSVTLDGDSAHVASKAVAYLSATPEGPITIRGLEYLDDVVREPDGWKISRRFHKAFWQYEVIGQSLVRRD